jgi:hypothetical protein
MATTASTHAFAPNASVTSAARGRARRVAPACAASRGERDAALPSRVTLDVARGGQACSSASRAENGDRAAGPAPADAKLFAACAALAVATSLGASPSALAVPTKSASGDPFTTEKVSLADEAKRDFLKIESALNRDLRVVSREIAIDKELLERNVERVPVTVEQFLTKEPPILVGMLAIAVINGCVGLTWALFFRETEAGPGGEVGKGVAKLRGEIVKGIFKFFGSVMGSYTAKSNRN